MKQLVAEEDDAITYCVNEGERLFSLMLWKIIFKKTQLYGPLLFKAWVQRT